MHTFKKQINPRPLLLKAVYQKYIARKNDYPKPLIRRQKYKHSVNIIQSHDDGSQLRHLSKRQKFIKYMPVFILSKESAISFGQHNTNSRSSSSLQRCQRYFRENQKRFFKTVRYCEQANPLNVYLSKYSKLTAAQFQSGQFDKLKASIRKASEVIIHGSPALEISKIANLRLNYLKSLTLVVYNESELQRKSSKINTFLESLKNLNQFSLLYQNKCPEKHLSWQNSIFKKITKLQYWHPNLIKKLPQLPNIQELILDFPQRDCNIDFATLYQQGDAQSLKKFELNLIIPPSKMASHFAELKKIQFHPNLQVLRLSLKSYAPSDFEYAFTHEEVEQLHQNLGQLSNLRELRVTNNKQVIQYQGLIAFFVELLNSINCESIEKLDTYTLSLPTDYKSKIDFKRFKNVKQLSLNNMVPTTTVFDLENDFPKVEKLTYYFNYSIYLQNNPKQICQFKPSRTLKEIDLRSSYGMDKAQFSEIACLVAQSPKIEKVKIDAHIEIWNVVNFFKPFAEKTEGLKNLKKFELEVLKLKYDTKQDMIDDQIRFEQFERDAINKFSLNMQVKFSVQK